jgi:hypothetical protein
MHSELEIVRISKRRCLSSELFYLLTPDDLGHDTFPNINYVDTNYITSFLYYYCCP